VIAPAADPATLLRAHEAIAALGIEIEGPNEAIATEAARLRHRHPVSLPEAYRLAKHTKSTLASFDQKVLKAARAESPDDLISIAKRQRHSASSRFVVPLLVGQAASREDDRPQG
jgi:hypothetical protein